MSAYGTDDLQFQAYFTALLSVCLSVCHTSVGFGTNIQERPGVLTYMSATLTD